MNSFVSPNFSDGAGPRDCARLGATQWEGAQGSHDAVVARMPSPAGLAAGGLGDAHGPAHDPVLELVVGHVLLAGLDLPAHRDPGLMHGFGVAGDQRMPPIELLAVSQQTIAAARWEPDDLLDVPGG